MVEDIVKLAKAFDDYGPWVLVIALGVVIWRMAVYIQKQTETHHETVQKLLLDHNAAQKEETKQLVIAMMSTEKAIQSVNNTLTVLSSRRDA